MSQQYNSQQRQTYAQNFVKNPSLIRYIIDFIKLPEGSLILDLGAGQGIITRELLKRDYRVEAIELDTGLYQQLQADFGDKAKIIQQDIRSIKYPIEPFYIISNPPFNIFSELVKGIYLAKNSPEAALIFGQKEAIERVIGQTEPSIISIILNSIYKCEIVYNFEADDFSPKPNVEVKLLRLEKIPTSIWKHKQDYIKFISYAFSQQKSNLGKNLEDIFTYEQWKRLAKTHQFHIQAKPQELSISQWKGLYQYYLNSVDKQKKRLVG
jgi:16S rRNA A1518/A1519 N6-dimethyltransferase RsmA/KsgA/DIM1 with predicted DNA glycosylase/AP lyase activity